jgi:hypothetical protein
MSININISDETAEGVLEKLKVLAASIIVPKFPCPEAGTASYEEAASTTAAEEAPVKKVRKPRATKEVKVEEPVATPEDVKAQDEADEAEESAAAKPAGKPLTHDDARSAFAPYIKKYGMTAAQADASSLLQGLFGAEVKAVKDIPDNQEALSKAIAAAAEMLETNPHGREAV